MMRSAVQLTDQLRAAAQVSPMAFMNRSSRLLTGVDLKHISLTQLDWQATQQSALSDEPVSTLSDYSKLDSLNHYGRLSGFVEVSQSSYKQSIQQLNRLADSFRQQPEVLSVKVRRYPIDTRSEADLTLQLEQKATRTDDEKAGRFEIDILLRGQL
jgi:hypothetical protein